MSTKMRPGLRRIPHCYDANYSWHLGFDFILTHYQCICESFSTDYRDIWYFTFSGKYFYTKVSLSRKRASQMLVATFRPKYLHPLAVKNDWCGEIKIKTFTHNLARRVRGMPLKLNHHHQSECKIFHFWICLYLVISPPHYQSHGQTLTRV